MLAGLSGTVAGEEAKAVGVARGVPDEAEGRAGAGRSQSQVMSDCKVGGIGAVDWRPVEAAWRSNCRWRSYCQNKSSNSAIAAALNPYDTM